MPRISPSALKQMGRRQEGRADREAAARRDLDFALRRRLEIPFELPPEQLVAAVLNAIDNLDREREAATVLACERELARRAS